MTVMYKYIQVISVMTVPNSVLSTGTFESSLHEN